MDRRRDLSIIAASSLILTLLVWAPFLLHLKSFFGIPLQNSGINSLTANFDGPYYIVVSKTFYRPQTTRLLFSLPLPLEYYPAHFPLFPLIIRLFSPVLGSELGMLTATTLGTVLATIAAYQLFVQENLGRLSLAAALASLVLPARWLVVHSVGSPEPWFIFFILLSLLFFSRKNYWLAGLSGSLATLTKSPGIILFVAFLLKILHDFLIKKQKLELKIFPILLIPISLLALFYFYYLQTGDFFAYFHSGDNIHLQPLPFQIFNSRQSWVGTFWLEDIIYLYLLAGLGLITLISQKRGVIAWFYGIFLTSLAFVSHRDLARYSLPLAPLAILAFSPLLQKRGVKILLVILVVPIYLYTLSFITNNVLPTSDWAPFR